MNKQLFQTDIDRGAEFSPCRLYRYALWRIWEFGRQPSEMNMVAFIGLNPSTADEMADDPTIRRCINFAKAWGYSGLYMLNIFAFRATQPADMMAAVDPIGPGCDLRLVNYCNQCKIMVAAWGKDGSFMGRGDEVKARLQSPLFCLDVNVDGSPKHPLYVNGKATPKFYYSPTAVAETKE